MWLDSLESRRLLSTVHAPDYDGTVAIHGTSGADVVAVLPVSNGFTLIFNASVRSYSFSNFKKLRVSLAGGNDQFIVMGSSTVPIEVNGEAGNDSLITANGNDTLRGGSGSDFLSAGLGKNDLYGHDGNDTVSYAWSRAGVYVSLDNGRNDGVQGNARDNVRGDIENIVGSAGHDYLQGNDAANRIEGGTGGDYIRGGGGNDTLIGGQGTDVLFGDAGKDRLEAGNDKDVDAVYWEIGDTYQSNSFDQVYRRGIDW